MSLEWLTSETLTMLNTGHDLELEEFSIFAGGMQNDTALWETGWQFLQTLP